MISSLDAAAQSFLSGLGQIQQKMDTAQAQLTTGLAINNDSDSPDQIADLWQTRSNLDQADQISSNLNQVQTEVNTGESVLQTAVTLVEQAETLGAQGASDTVNSDTRQDLAKSLGSVLQQLVAVANTQVAGRYIFSGDDDQQPPYSIDLTQSTPVSSYQGTASTRQIQGADGSTFPVALTAQQIFDSSDATQNVFTSITSLMQGLQNNDDTAINSALADVQSSDTYLNQQLAFYGTTQDRVQSGISFAQNYTTQLQTQLSGIQDANAAEAATDLTEAQTQYQAALESRAQIPNTSLFNYLG
jgi:flagellar hook-associated protein 3 FlgL